MEDDINVDEFIDKAYNEVFDPVFDIVNSMLYDDKNEEPKVRFSSGLLIPEAYHLLTSNYARKSLIKK